MSVEIASRVSGTGPDRTALEGLYRTQYRPLLRLAAVMLGDISAAEEAVQDAFYRLLRRGIRELGDVPRQTAYLRATLVNVVRSQLRRRLVAGKYRWGGSARAISAEEMALLNEEQQAVIRTLRTLPVRQRECLALRFYLDLSEGQIADALGVSISSVKTHLRRGLAAMAARMEEQT